MSVTLEQMIDAIYGQESSHGKANTEKANYAGARGPMQVTEKTFNLLRGQGIIPADWKHSDPKQSKEAGNRLVGHLFNKYNGDPAKVAAAYYAGEKAIRPDGTIANFRDLKDKSGKAPTTHQYRDQVLKRLGMLEAESVPAPEAPLPSDPLDIPMPGKDLKTTMAARQPSTLEAIPTIPTDVPQVSDPYARYKQAEAQAIGEETERKDTGMWEMAGGSWLHSTMLGNITKAALRPDYAANPLYTLDEKKLEGLTAAEQEQMRSAVSQEHEDRIKFEIDEYREYQRKNALNGPWMAFAADMLGGLPEGALVGMGAARGMMLAGKGAITYAQAGRRGAAIGSTIVENVGGNLAATAVQDIFDPHVGGWDYAISVGMGGLVSPLSIPAINQAALAHDVRRAAQKITENAVNEGRAIQEAAVRNMGEGATPDQIRAEANRIEAEKIKVDLDGATGPVPTDRILVPEAEREILYGQGAVDDLVEKSKTDTGPAVGEAIGEDEIARLNRLAAEDKIRGTTPDGGNMYSATQVLWDDPHFLKNRVLETADNPRINAYAQTHTDGEFRSLKQIGEKAPVGITITKAARANPALRAAIATIEELGPIYLPKDVKLVVGTGIVDKNPSVRGEALSGGDKVHTIGLKPMPDDLNPINAVHTATHELSHVIWHSIAKLISPAQMARIRLDYSGFLVKLRAKHPDAEWQRYSLTAPNIGGAQMPRTAYNSKFDEYVAEQIVKHIEAQAIKNPKVYSKDLVGRIVKAIDAIKNFFTDAQMRGYAKPDQGIDEVMTAILNKQALTSSGLDAYMVKGGTGDPLDSIIAAQRGISDQEIAETFGFDKIPQKTPQEKAEWRAMVHLYRRAMDPSAPWNAPDLTQRLSTFLDTAVFEGAQSASSIMLRSTNPVTRMLAVELLESASGAGGRRATAAISKELKNAHYMGNVLNDVQGVYKEWRNAKGATWVDDTFRGKEWESFNKSVAQEIEARRSGEGSPNDVHVSRAADAIEAAYERMRLDQIRTKTIGWAALPESSVGYMPHRMSAHRLRNATNSQVRVLHGLLQEQFQSIEGFDAAFSRELASGYIDRIRNRGVGGFEAPMNIHQTGAADVIRDALEAMNMTRAEVDAVMGRYMRGGPGHTKKRLELDLNRVYETDEGAFRLLDMFETDQFRLIRTQAHRVSGEVALARHGIMGKPGLKLMKRAMVFGQDDGKATLREHEAFDQVAAEFMGDPFGTQTGKWMERAMLLNSATRLGGMGFTQLAESINFIPHVGAMKALSSVFDLARLRRETIALAKGEVVDNELLKSLEQFGGKEFGTENRKLIFPFDNPELQYQTFGQDTATAADRLLRGAVHVQGKLSMWRALHGAQQRGAAEQIVIKAMEYAKSGREDRALKEMGIDAQLLGTLRANLNDIAVFEGNKLVSFDITKLPDVGAAEDFVQAVHRGASQIIQGTFIGERGKWAHDGIMRVVTQFRTFSLTSIEKQWARQQGSLGGGYVGAAKAFGILLGAMSFAAPIYILRTYINSIGREDQAAYLERQLSPWQIGRATMNYVALTGLAGDMLDAVTAVTGVGTVTGGRTGVGKEFVGNVIAPAAGLVDDIWRGIQNTKEGTDPHDLIKNGLPFSRHPLLVPMINALD